jgi:hypothetical protein
MTTEPVEFDDPELFAETVSEDVPVIVIEAFDGRRGVFLLTDPAPAVRAEAIDHGWHTLTMDTTGVDDRDGFVEAIGDALDLPGLDAGSWDSLDQHLRAIDLDEPNGLLICWEGWAQFAESDPDSFEMAVEVLQDACVAWEYDEFQAAVLLLGHGPETDLPTW